MRATIPRAYQNMQAEYGEGRPVAARSSTTAEDLPTASFAGPQGRYLYVHGDMACEIPSNALPLDDFARYFEGLSAGSNDLTQLAIGVARCLHDGLRL